MLTADERPYQFTHDNPPSAGGYAAFLADLATRRIILDDDNNDQNDAVSTVRDEPYPYPSPGLSVANRVPRRRHDRRAHRRAALVVRRSDRHRRLADPPDPGRDYTFEPANPVPAAPGDVGGDLQGRQLQRPQLLHDDRHDVRRRRAVRPVGDARLPRRRLARPSSRSSGRRSSPPIGAIDADVVGLDRDAERRRRGRRATSSPRSTPGPAPAPYALVDTGSIGTDAIKVAFIYRPSTVTPVGAVRDPRLDGRSRFIDTRNRPALIQTFEEVATGERFTAAINHFKSKGSALRAPTIPTCSTGRATATHPHRRRRRRSPTTWPPTRPAAATPT